MDYITKDEEEGEDALLPLVANAEEDIDWTEAAILADATHVLIEEEEKMTMTARENEKVAQADDNSTINQKTNFLSGGRMGYREDTSLEDGSDIA
jgi:hypothetical protein